MTEAPFNWEPVAFFAWMVLSLLGAGLIATIKASGGVYDWLRWYGILFLVGMGTGLVVVALIKTYRAVAGWAEVLSGWMAG